MKKFAAGIITVLAMLAILGAASIIMPIGGGTGVASPTAHRLPVSEGSSPFNFLSGTGCPSYTSSADPTFVACGGGAGGGFAWGGNGNDSAITADGSTTYGCLGAPGTFQSVASSYRMVYDCNATTFQVNDGVTIFTNGLRIFAQTSITVGQGSSGVIRNSALNNASANGGNGGAGGSAAATGGAAGTAAVEDQQTAGNLPTGCLWTTIANCMGSLVVVPGQAGGTGTATGTTGPGVEGATTQTASYDVCTNGPSAAGAVGGNGGTGALSGGSGGAARGSAPCSGQLSGAVAATSLPYALTWFPLPNGTLTTVGITPTNAGASSGGAGGGDNGTNKGGGGGGSGANGGYGNLVILSAPTITVNAGAIVQADGTNGGNGGNGGTPLTGANNGGGGGGSGGQGGSGGVIVLVYHTYTNSGSVHATHGSGGTKGSHGNGIGSGANGTDGNNGNNGIDGVIYQFPQ